MIAIESWIHAFVWSILLRKGRYFPDVAVPLVKPFCDAIWPESPLTESVRKYSNSESELSYPATANPFSSCFAMFSSSIVPAKPPFPSKRSQLRSSPFERSRFKFLPTTMKRPLKLSGDGKNSSKFTVFFADWFLLPYSTPPVTRQYDSFRVDVPSLVLSTAEWMVVLGSTRFRISEHGFAQVKSIKIEAATIADGLQSFMVEDVSVEIRIY